MKLSEKKFLLSEFLSMLSCLSSKSKISFLHLNWQIKSFSVLGVVSKDVLNLEIFKFADK